MKTFALKKGVRFACFALALVFSFDARAAQTVHQDLPAGAKGLRPFDRLAPTNRLNLAIALPLRNPDQLDQLLHDLYDPASHNFRHYLTTEQFTERFGPTEADYQAVIAYAKTNGLRPTTLHSNRMLVDVNGSVADVEKALHLKMQVYQHPKEARTFYAPDSEPTMDLAVSVLSISGLDNYSQARPHLVRTRPSQVPCYGSGPSGTYMGQDFRAAYVPDTTLTGSGQILGLVEFDGYDTNDIAAYENMAGLPSVTLSNVLIDGFNGLGSGDEGQMEVSLDIEMAISMAPDLLGIVVYEITNGGSWPDMLNCIANDNLAKQISCSWYEPEIATIPAAEQIFQQLAAQGQSFFAASGDSGAFTNFVPFPGDSPHITLVGGTSLTTSGPTNSWLAEEVWHSDGLGSGGGISPNYPIPYWQTNISMEANHGSTTMRNIPDVALTADYVFIYYVGVGVPGGGTSCAAPLWAGFTALVNQQAAMSGRPPVGFINPALDIIGSDPNYAACFHDITNGDNTCSSSPSNYYAVPEYDLCTGWGTPARQNLIVALATPDTLVIQPYAGFTATGGSGGPFTATSESFVLTNFGSNPITWSLVNTSSWLAVSPPGGTLSAEGPDTTPLVSLSADAYSLPIGNYSSAVVFSNVTDGVAHNISFTLQVVPSIPPSIQTQPTNQTIYESFTAAFSVTINGTLPLVCQWQFNTANINGATNSILTLTNVGLGQAGDYRVMVSNAYGTTYSSNALLTVFPLPGCDPAPSGLISWWPAEGNADDVAGTNNGTLVNGVSFAPGEVGRAFNFSRSGPDEYVQIPDSPSLEPVSVSLECWFEENTAGGSGTLISKSAGSGLLLAGTDSYKIWLEGGYLEGSVGHVNNRESAHQAAVIYGFNAVPGVWYHAAYTFDNNAQIQTLYLNGVAVASNSPGLAISYDSHPVLIGADWFYDSPFLPFNGEIDEASIYNRALTGAEVASIFAAAISGKCTSPPVIKTQPASQSVESNCAATFSVSAAGAVPLGYQWLQNNVVLAGQTNATLVIPSVQTSNLGNYGVAVANRFCAVTSAVAVLALASPPVANPNTILRFAGGGVRINVADLTSNDTVALYDTLSFTGVSSSSAAGGAVFMESPWVYYTPPASDPATDTFTYTVSDGHCGMATGTVTIQLKANNPQPANFGIAGVTNGILTLTCEGIPGWGYHLEWTDSLSPPNWRVLTNQVADNFGLLQFTDSSLTNATTRFYRVAYP